MTKYTKLFKNSLIFAIGNISSKALVFLLVPLYTSYFTPEEYGLMDLFTTTTNMLLPIVTLSIYEATLRYTLDKKNNQSEIISTGLFLTLIGLSVILLITFFLDKLNILSVDYLYYIYGILATQSIQTLFSQYARGVGKIKIYAFAGFLSAVSLVICSLFFIVLLQLKIEGYLLSIICTNGLNSVFLFIAVNIRKDLSPKNINSFWLKKMLYYSIPLIPNAFSWWLSTASSRYFILFYSGVTVNGLFAVATKIPTLLTTINSIFFQAWQISAIEEYESEDQINYYSETYINYFQFMFLCVSILLLILKPLVSIYTANDYFVSWIFIPLLLVATIYSSLSSFLGTLYIAAERTTKILWTTLTGGILNILFNLILIRYFGGVGAGAGSCISFIIIWFIRLRGIKNEFNIYSSPKLFLINNLIIFGQILAIFLLNNDFHLYLIQIVLFLLSCVCNKRLVEKVIMSCFRKVKKYF